jgi:hypothetical protein
LKQFVDYRLEKNASASESAGKICSMRNSCSVTSHVPPERRGGHHRTYELVPEAKYRACFDAGFFCLGLRPRHAFEMRLHAFHQRHQARGKSCGARLAHRDRDVLSGVVQDA